MSYADTISKSQTFDYGAYLDVGEYEAEVTKMLFKKSPQKGDVFIAELKLTHTSDEKKHPLGAKRSWVQKMADTTVSGPAMKSFIYAALGAVSPEQRAAVDPKIGAIVYQFEQGQNSILVGRVVHINVVPHTTKDKRAVSVTRFSVKTT